MERLAKLLSISLQKISVLELRVEELEIELETTIEQRDQLKFLSDRQGQLIGDLNYYYRTKSESDEINFNQRIQNIYTVLQETVQKSQIVRIDYQNFRIELSESTYTNAYRKETDRILASYQEYDKYLGEDLLLKIKLLNQFWIKGIKTQIPESEMNLLDKLHFIDQQLALMMSKQSSLLNYYCKELAKIEKQRLQKSL